MENSEIKEKKKKRIIGSMIFLAIAWLSGSLTFYSAPDIEARVIDANTGKPVEGVVLVGVWQLESQGFEHSYGRAIHVTEAVTDSEGKYKLDGFFIKWAGLFAGTLWESDPMIYVFADGYSPRIAHSDNYNAVLEHDTGFYRRSPHDGRDVLMRKIPLNTRYVAQVWYSQVRRLIDAGNCSATKLPSLTNLLERVEPQYNVILKDSTGFNNKPFNEKKEYCSTGP
ncbi:MAG: hypothetical protein OEZ16_04940 [Chromatiales bacterium]|nr:hypothetical protein [Chromatiales bacterium]